MAQKCAEVTLLPKKKQDAQLSQRDRAAGCVIVFAKSRRLELGDNILQTL